MACKQIKYVGRDVVLEYQIACGDEMPLANLWKLFGSMRTKEFNLEWETTDATADDSIGSLRENLATFQTLSISGDGVAKASGAGAANLKELTKHVANPVTTGQPVAWIRMTFPDLTFIAFMIVTNMSRSAPYDDVTTFSFEASATASDFGLIIDDTPDPDAEPITAITVVPTTLDMEVGETDTLVATVTPAEAPQGVVWQSGNTDVATVDQTGFVTAVGEGATTVTALSTVDATKTAPVVVTVTQL